MITVTLITDLRSRLGTAGADVLTLGRAIAGDGMGGIFYWDDTDATTADDVLNTIKVTGVSAGRWKRVLVPGLMAKAGSWVGSGVTLQTTYVIPHTLGMVPAVVLLESTLPASSGNCYVATKTATQFTVVFIAAPAAGTNNLGFDWQVSA